MPRETPRILAATGLAALSLACASYPERTSKAFGDFQAGHLERSLKAYEQSETTGSPFLAGAESGTVALAAGDWDAAIQNLGKAASEVEQVERSALISPESLGETILSWTVNEGMKRYLGEGYERVMLHVGLAIAYLAKGDFESARVEVRQSNALLESEEELYEKEYEAGGLGHFLSAVTYEMDGRPDDAWIDYRRMREKGLGTDLACRALARLAATMHREEDLDPDERQYLGTATTQDSASVVVIAGVGIGPWKREILVPIPTSSGLLQWAVPAFEQRPQPVDAVEISVAGGDRSVRTVVVEDVGSVAKENLEDRIAWLAAKSAVRAVAKREMSQYLGEEAGAFGWILGTAVTIVSERADLRAWQTLPHTWQAARVFLPPGTHEIRARALGGEARDLGRFELEPGETMFILARTVETRLYAYPVGGRRIVSAAAPITP
ncbi:MAG: hypothetical protein ACKVXR_06810 [Planctomycetota bacterium]